MATLRWPWLFQRGIDENLFYRRSWRSRGTWQSTSKKRPACPRRKRLFVDAEKLADLTGEFLDLKFKFFPELPYPSDNLLDRILPEIKGAELRRNVTRGTARQRNHTIGFLDRIFGLLRRHDVKLVARIWIKLLREPFSGKSVYISSIQLICSYFDHYLAECGNVGCCIADSREKLDNSNVSHSIFTQKFGIRNLHKHLIELPTFGHSDNHAGLQLCDIVCSALLYPIACHVYCTGHVNNVHVQPGAANLRNRHGPQLKALQYRYQMDSATSHFTGGIVVSDPIECRSGSIMFRPPKATEL